MADDWQTVDVVSADAPEITASPGGSAENASLSLLKEFLVEQGLGTFADKITQVTDAESLEDLKLLDADLVEEVIVNANLKLLSAKKFRNAIGELQKDRAAQSALQEPTVAERVDSFAEALPGGKKPRMLQECVAVCIDRSGSMGTPFAEVTLNVVKGATKDSVAQRTRMEAVKAMFYAFRDRVESVGNGSHQLGLLQFDNRVEELLDLTPQLDHFETIVDDMEKRGQTAIYSSIIAAAKMLAKEFHEESQVDLRVLVLTDGQSNTGADPQSALEAVNNIGAVVDAIIVGDRPDANLRKIVTATGGECYQISDLGEGFELLEAEGVVSLRARRGHVPKPPFQRRPAVDFDTLAEKQLTKGTAVQRVPDVASGYAQKQCVDIASLANSNVDTSLSNANKYSQANNAACAKRILKELKQLASGAENIWLHSGEGIQVFPAEDTLNFWRALIEGPAGSPFEGGVFALNVVIPDNYPLQAPKITFETPIYHCNMSDNGKICLDILLDKWSPSLSVPKCLEAIRFLMREPDTDNSLRQWIADLTIAHRKYKDTETPDDRYFEKARECTRSQASMSVVEWKQKWNC